MRDCSGVLLRSHACPPERRLRVVRRVIGALPGQRMGGSGSVMRPSRPIRQIAAQDGPRSPTLCPQASLTSRTPTANPTCDITSTRTRTPTLLVAHQLTSPTNRAGRTFRTRRRLSPPSSAGTPRSAGPPPRRPLPQPNLSPPDVRIALLSAALLRGPTRGGDARVRRALRGRGPSHL